MDEACDLFPISSLPLSPPPSPLTQNLRAVGVSAHSGAGMEEFFAAVDDAKREYYDEYKPLLEKLMAEKEKAKEAERQRSMERLKHDLETAGDVVIDASKKK